MKIYRTPYYSWRIGDLAEGCRQCVKGEKLVLFATGLCPRRCWFCPLAETKKNKDVVFANEWKISNDKDIVTEAKLCDAKGTSLTGGDPFVVFERSLKYIKLLKKTFGKKFHIHMYVPGEAVTMEKLRKFYSAGLDEIRFHPRFENGFDKDDKSVKAVLMALSPEVKSSLDQFAHDSELLTKRIPRNSSAFKWKVGIEIPVIPKKEKQIKDLIDFFDGKIDFLNLNELEVSDTNMDAMIKRGFIPKDRVSYAVKGSQELALKLLNYCENKKLRVHYCTSTLKDKVQLARRIKRRAINAKKAYDYMKYNGALTRGAIHLPELSPDFGYHKKIEKADKTKVIKRLEKIKDKLQKKFDIPKNMIEVDKVKLRILTAAIIVDELKKELKEMKFVPAIVEEFPTWDETEISVQIL